MDNMNALITRSYVASAATWPFFAVSTILIAVRLFSQLRLRKNAAGWDDLLLAISWALDAIRQGLFQQALSSSRQIAPQSDPDSLSRAAFWSVLAGDWCFLSIGLPKLAIAIMIVRVFAPSRRLTAFIIGFALFIIVGTIGGFIITLVQCSPVPGQWDPINYPQTRCWNRNIQGIYACTLSGFSALFDLMYSVYPGMMIWRLQMPTWKKAATTALMGLGLASFGVAVVKTYATSLLIEATDPFSLLYNSIFVDMWLGIENDVLLSAASLPSIIPACRYCRSFVLSKLPTYGVHPLPGNVHRPLNTDWKQGRDQTSESWELAAHGGPIKGPSSAERAAQSSLETTSL